MKFALISFLNARPLWWGLIHEPGAERDSHVFTSPARCADLLVEGSAHLGLIPSIELFRSPDLAAVPSLCIASRTEVRSVLLFSRVPFGEIRSVSLDPSSRTSVALAKILLAERLGDEVYQTIRFDPADRERLPALEGHDAAVIIGDPALQLTRQASERGIYRYDLVSEWHAMFGEPFVFALWAGRRDILMNEDLDRLRARLRESLEFGIRHLDRIAREASEELSLPFEELIEYFRSALHYEVGESERNGLARFCRLAKKHGLIREAKEIEWLESTPDTPGPEVPRSTSS